MFQRILVPTDFSETAQRALDHAIEVARAFEASIHLVHVHSLPMVYTPDGVMMGPLWNEADVRTDLQQGLSRAAAEVRARGIPEVTTELLDGPAWQEIVKAATDGGAELIVIGTHGRSGLKHFLLGSVAEHVVRKATCPVLTVGPEKRD
jgi:nucleotide-binding universal stress UspA family protein